MVRQFIEELNGEIYIESELNQGSIFTCFIPLQQPLLDDEFGVTQEFPKTKVEVLIFQIQKNCY